MSVLLWFRDDLRTADHEALRDETTRRTAAVVRAIESGRIAMTPARESETA